MHYAKIEVLEEMESEVLVGKLTADEASELVKELEKLLGSSQVEQAWQLVNEPRFEQCLADCCWELITAIASHLEETVLADNRPLFECCCSLMDLVAERCPAEEALLQIIDQVESLNDVRFTTLLKPMQATVLRIESKLGLSVEWCFNSIHRHLEALPYPDDQDLEDDERKLMDGHPYVQRIAHLYAAVVPTFYQPFLDKVKVSSGSSLDEKNREHLRDAVLCSCLRLLGKPLVFMDLEHEEEAAGGGAKSSVRTTAELVMDMMHGVHADLMAVLQLRSLTNMMQDIRDAKQALQKDLEPRNTFPVEEKYSSVSLAVFCYLMYGEGVKLETMAQVYNPLLILSNNLYLAVVLLNGGGSALVQRKGLVLVRRTLGRFVDLSVPDQQLDSPTYRHLVEALYVVAVYSHWKSNRQLAVTLIKQLLFKLDVNGRYLLLVKMIKLANHSGIMGYLATLYKDVLVDVLDGPPLAGECFTEKRITYLLDNFCQLPNKAHSDLVELSDQIISCLNLLRFIIIKDRANRTGIKQYVKVLEKGFFRYLLDGINLSRAHYRLKLEDVEGERRKRKSVNPGGPGRNANTTAIYIGKDKVPNLPVDEKIFIIRSALNGFDVMESLLCRVNECVDIYIK